KEKVVIAICKDTKLKAIHNWVLAPLAEYQVVIAICKDTKLKAIHNNGLYVGCESPVVIAICKDTKLKAIHNYLHCQTKTNKLLLLFAKILN
ncbi:MAG: hypothetical protein J6R06_07950, partial [Bacteroidales bacterium]|nr:hypothetical protein [Bacteroidales bacterium]